MNPFDVSRFQTINLKAAQFESLPMNMTQDEFLSSVRETIVEKMSGVNTQVFVDFPYSMPGMKQINLVGGYGDGNLGDASTIDGIAKIYVENILNACGSVDVLPEAVGTVASHEIAHLLLPGGPSMGGHSIMNTSLIAEGPLISEHLMDGGKELFFTPLQTQLMNVKISAQKDPAILSYLENTSLVDWERSEEKMIEGFDQYMHANPELLYDLDPSIWGDFNPSIMDSIAGVGDLSIYGEFAESFDFSGMESGMSDGLAEALGFIDSDIAKEFAPELIDGGDSLVEGLLEIISQFG